MNEEEKKAIETLKSWKDYNIRNKNKLLRADEIIKIQETILNLIEKLQKENEEYSKQLDLDYVDKNYIPKQKIKAKIEELNKTINKCGIIYSLKQCARCQKDVLEKLLIEESED